MLPTNLTLHLEALVFSSKESITLEELLQAIQNTFLVEISTQQILTYLENIKRKHSEEQSIFDLVELNGGYQFLTKRKYHETINHLEANRAKKKLSQAALETLAIVAYKQPITKLEIEQIRGVNSDYSVQRLLEKDLISIQGKAESLGKPILYKTSDTFMDYFGLKDLKGLPQLKDFAKLENVIGEELD